MTRDSMVERSGVTLRWCEDGVPGAPPLLLLNSLGTDLRMWDKVVALLARDFRLLRMDMRGHGQSSTPPGDATMQELALDALAVLDAAGVARASVCGLSIGGMIALQMAMDAPERINALVVCNSSAQVPAKPWSDRAALVRAGGMHAVIDAVIARFFSEPFRKAEPSVVAATRKTLSGTDPQGYSAACMAIAGLNIFDRLAMLQIPLLVINGDMDSATPPDEHGDRVAAQVPGARTVVLPAGHLSALECPEPFAAAVMVFIGKGISQDGEADHL